MEDLEYVDRDWILSRILPFFSFHERFLCLTMTEDRRQHLGHESPCPLFDATPMDEYPIHRHFYSAHMFLLLL